MQHHGLPPSSPLKSRKQDAASGSGASTKKSTESKSLESNDQDEAIKQYLFELEIDSGPSDEKSLFSAISTPIVLKDDDASSFDNHKLKLDSLGLHGREVETATLMTAFNNLSSSHPAVGEVTTSEARQRQLVLISGTSGTGKTKLAETLKDPAAQQGGLYVRGKFALNMINQPYSGIASACAELCGAILDLRVRSPAQYKKVGDGIVSALDSELGLLVQVIPVLEEIVDVPIHYSASSSSAGPASSSDSKNQILFAFRRFLRVITSVFSPLIITLDDLQWADTSSFDLLEATLSDRQISRAMVIGVYRSNEVDTNPRLSEFLRHVDERKGKTDFSTTRIEIKDLDVTSVNAIIQAALDCKDDDRSLKLAEVCHKKTLGNPFFLLQFLSLLGQKNLLQRTRVVKSWTWNLEDIERNTHASDNVVDLLKARMTELPSELSEMLQVAACLGATFDQETLRTGLSRIITDEGAFQGALGELQKEGLLVKVASSPPRFSFVHDKIHEAAADLIPETSRSRYRRSVGEVLFQGLSVDRLASEIFVVVNLLNDIEPPMLTRESRLKLAELNHQASDRAVMVSAFDSAARYAGKGIELLGDDALLENTYALSLGLYAIGAKAEGAMGNIETLERYCMSVIQRNEIPLEDKFGAYNTWMEHLLNRNVNDAVALCLDILGRHNCYLPKNPAGVSLELAGHLLRIKATMKTRRLSSLETMTDKSKLQIMHWLDKLFLGFYLSSDDRLPLAIFRMLNLTLKHGVSPYAPSAFAQTGLILVGLTNDIQSAAVYGEHALELLSKSQSMDQAARTAFVVHSFVFPWAKPLRKSFDPLMEAYNMGLKFGDTENMSWAAVNWLQLKLYAGAPLDVMEVDFDMLMSHMQAVKMHRAYTFMQPVHQTVLNLIGYENADDPTSLVGEALSNEELEACLNDPFFKPSICIHQCILLTYFGEHVQHAELFAGMGPDYVAQALVGAPENMINTFVNGLSCFAAARETGEKRYIKLGQVCRRKIKKWADMNNPNVKHYVLLLDAEHVALTKKHSAAVECYMTAILSATQGDFIQDAALGSERLGEYYLKVSGDRNEAHDMIRQAAGYWLRWGAGGKVRHLQEKYPDAFIVAPHTTNGSVGMVSIL